MEENKISWPVIVFVTLIIIAGAVYYSQQNKIRELTEIKDQTQQTQLAGISGLGSEPEFQLNFLPQPQPEQLAKPEPKPKPKPKPKSVPQQPQPTSYCGDGICKESESRNTCSDCVYIPMADEEVISSGNVISIFNKQLGGEWQVLKVKDILRCNSIIKDKFKIDLSEPAKTKMLILTLLTDKDEEVYSYVNPYGVVHIHSSNSYQSLIKNLDYFKEKIDGEGVCLSFREVVHVFLYDRPIPTWASQGLATYADLKYNPVNISIACQESSWLASDGKGGNAEQPYSDLSLAPGQNGEEGIFWFYTANCFWDHIKEKYGEVAITAILQELQRNKGKDSADFLKDIVNKILKEDITNITKQKFNVTK